MAKRRPGQLIVTWDPNGVIGENDYPIRDGIETARIDLPRYVGFGSFPALVVAVGVLMRRKLWPIVVEKGGQKKGKRPRFETGFDLQDPPHTHGDGRIVAGEQAFEQVGSQQA